MTRPHPTFRHPAGVPLGVALLAALALAACVPTGAEYRIGYATYRISGHYILPAFRPEDGPPLVIAYKHHYKFVTLESGQTLTHPTADVVVVGADGEYAVDMPGDVVAIDILFVAPDHLSREFHFRRQIGIGDITYHPQLIHVDRWRDHYYTYLLPQLEHLIVEPRYQLSHVDQQRLGDWLRAQQARLRRAAGQG